MNLGEPSLFVFRKKFIKTFKAVHNFKSFWHLQSFGCKKCNPNASVGQQIALVNFLCFDNV